MPLPKHTKGIVATILFHGLLLLYIWFCGFRTPLPLPEEAGVLVDWGESPAGQGEIEKQEMTPTESEPAPPAPTPSPEQVAPIITQDVEESVAVVPPPAEEKPAPVAGPVKPERTVNPQALFPGKNTTATGGEGNTSTPGNQGVQTGAPDVKVYGEGQNAGGGNSFDLSGRNLVGSLPRPAYTKQIEGIVVIEITVDKEGNVTQAQYRLKGSTTSDETLVNAARTAALRAHFDRKPEATLQVGTITYIFRLQD